MFAINYLTLGVLLWLGGIQLSLASAIFNVTMDTSSLSGAPALIAFDFIDGDQLVNNTVTISGFSGDGVYDPAAATTFGDVTGALNTSVVLGDSQVFNELAQPITLGNALSFTLNLSNQFSGPGLPDRFTLFLLDGTGIPLYPTDDPTRSDALFAIDLSGGAIGAMVYAPTGADGAVVGVTAVPEPPSLLLWLFGAVVGGRFLRTAPRHHCPVFTASSASPFSHFQ